MAAIVRWWCDLIGIADPMAIQVATGIVAAGLGLFAVGLAVAVITGLFSNKIH